METIRSFCPPPPPEGEGWIAHFRLRGTPGAAGGDQTLLAGWQIWEGPVALWIGLTGNPPAPDGATRAGARASARNAGTGRVSPSGTPFDVEIAMHSGMGPGGVLVRSPGGVVVLSRQQRKPRCGAHGLARALVHRTEPKRTRAAPFSR